MAVGESSPRSCTTLSLLSLHYFSISACRFCACCAFKKNIYTKFSYSNTAMISLSLSFCAVYNTTGTKTREKLYFNIFLCCVSHNKKSESQFFFFRSFYAAAPASERERGREMRKAIKRISTKQK